MLYANPYPCHLLNYVQSAFHPVHTKTIMLCTLFGQHAPALPAPVRSAYSRGGG